MEEFYTTLLTNFVTILIALLAGLVALYQVKSNIISDARIKWIESLREEISNYCMEIENANNSKNTLFDERKGKKGLELESIIDKFYEPYEKSNLKALKVQSKVFLYLNSEKPKHKEIEDLMNLNSLLLLDIDNFNRLEIKSNVSKIVFISKEIFTEEWKKSKEIFKI